MESHRKQNKKRSERITDEEREKINEKQRIQAKERYEKRKNAGLCTKCGKRASFKWGLCIDCYLKIKQKRNKRISREERPAYGKCYICNSPTFKDLRVCKKCSENLEKARKARKNGQQNHIWKSNNKLVFR